MKNSYIFNHLIHIFNHTPINSLITIGCLFIFLICATCISWYKKISNRDQNKNYSELMSRIYSWWVIIILISIFLLLGTAISIAFFAFVAFLGVKELLSIIDLRIEDRKIVILVYLSIIGQFIFVYLKWYGMFIIFIPVYIQLLVTIRSIILGVTTGYIKSLTLIQWSVSYVVFSIAHLAYLLNFSGNTINIKAGSVGLVLFIIIITQINDVNQYIWGKTFGKRKITPNISPNKTLEGLIGGIFTTSIISMIISPYLTPFNFWEGGLLGLLLGTLGFLGDISMSAVKRDLNIKDTSNLIPGHGGILDRLDSLLFTAPIFFHITNYYFN